MRFLPRLFLSHLLVIALAVAGLFVAAELFAPNFYRAHVDEMVQTLGPAGAELRGNLEHGMRLTLTRALGASVPLAVLVAIGAALLSSRRVVRGVEALRAGSEALAAGEYHARLQAGGRDELSDLAHNFNVMAERLERVEQGRVELISNVAHELRAPLAALRGYADAITDGVMAPGHAAGAITREVAAMERLVQDLSLVSRVEAGRIELRLQTLDVAGVLAGVQERFSLAFEERGVGLVMPPGPFPAVRADRERLAQVLTNLLGNALRHTPRGGQVSLGVRVDSGALRFEVTDTGPGIAPEHLDRVFERFYRVDAARARADGGSGVGLTIARGLTEAMGGRLSVASQVGRGSTFAFTVPLAG